MDRIRRIGVVTVTYNSAIVLPEFLASVVQQGYPDFVLYVVDNGSADGSVRIARSFGDPRIRVVENRENLGVAEANNQGIRAALADGCDAVLLLNNDTVFKDELFSRLVEGLERYPCGMATPKIYPHGEPNTIWAAGGYFQPWLGYRNQHYGAGRHDDGQFNSVRQIDYAPTCCVLIHKKVFKTIGLMDSIYFVYMDDVDFMFRATRAGFAVAYLPQCKLWHKVSSLTGGSESRFTVRYCTRNRIYFLLKNQPALLAWPHVTGYVLYLAVRFLVGIDKPEIWSLKRNSLREGFKLYAQSPRLGNAEDKSF